jgi:hypothetical protein
MSASNVTDLSGRIFNNITGFQYAVWALDWHMWRMIRKYLSDDAAREQMTNMARGSWVGMHGINASGLIQNLVDALQTYIDNHDQWRANNVWCLYAHWEQNVGSAQRLLPAHVVNEYCHPTRPFEPCPHFDYPHPLPRSRRISGNGDEWFTASSNAHRLGDRNKFGFAFLRFNFSTSTAFVGSRMRGHDISNGPPVRSDRLSVHTLLVTRLRQCDELFAELRVSAAPAVGRDSMAVSTASAVSAASSTGPVAAESVVSSASLADGGASPPPAMLPGFASASAAGAAREPAAGIASSVSLAPGRAGTQPLAPDSKPGF